MSGSYAAHMHEQPFRATKYPVQPLASRKSVFALRQKDLTSCFITSVLVLGRSKLFSNVHTYFRLSVNSLL